MAHDGEKPLVVANRVVVPSDRPARIVNALNQSPTPQSLAVLKDPSMVLSLRQIEVLHAVMATGTISAASKRLFVSQPAISRLLSHSEQRVGFPLFERINGRLHATDEAKQLSSRSMACNSRPSGSTTWSDT